MKVPLKLQLLWLFLKASWQPTPLLPDYLIYVGKLSGWRIYITPTHQLKSSDESSE